MRTRIFANKVYHDKLRNLKSWPIWQTELEEFDKHANAAFEGTENLHNYQTCIEQLSATYANLKQVYTK